MTVEELAKGIIGLDTTLARYAIRALGFIPRVCRKDGKSAVITMDYRLDRINLDIMNGKVTKATIG